METRLNAPPPSMAPSVRTTCGPLFSSAWERSSVKLPLAWHAAHKSAIATGGEWICHPHAICHSCTSQAGQLTGCEDQACAAATHLRMRPAVRSIKQPEGHVGGEGRSAHSGARPRAAPGPRPGGRARGRPPRPPRRRARACAASPAPPPAGAPGCPAPQLGSHQVTRCHAAAPTSLTVLSPEA